MNAWNVSYAMPEILLGVFSLTVLVLDARSPADDKRRAVRMAHTGCWPRSCSGSRRSS